MLSRSALMLVVSSVIMTTALTTSRAIAQPTSTGSISLQGRLAEVADGTRQLTFFLHDAETGGTQVASVGPIATQVTGGVFATNVPMAAGTFDGRTLWWSVAVDGGAPSARQLVTSVPYAASAGRIAAVDGIVDFSGTFRNAADSPSRYSVEVSNASGAGGLVVSTTPGGGLLPFAVVFAGQPRFFVDSDGTTDNFGFLRSQSASPVRYSLEATNASGAGGLIVSTTPGGGLDPVAVFHAGQRLFTVLQSGSTRMRVLEITGGSDLAEPFVAAPASSQAVAPRPGMVLSIDPENPGALRVATEAYDTRVAGVYSGGNGLPTGMIMGKEGCDLTAPGEDKLPLAMTGRVWVYADESAEGGRITPGDRLTTSGVKPGHAMKVGNEARSIGAVIGKAMTGVDKDTGMVLVLVNLQ